MSDEMTGEGSGFIPLESATRPRLRVWPVGTLLRAIADCLEARFNPVAVQGELSGYSRAPSGHCYFSLKDEQGQIRCAMFRRTASMLDFSPRDGQLVELRGRLGVYDQRGELQLVVESMRQAGQGNLFEEFLKLKARLESEGLFDLARKRPLPPMPRAIGVVTSLGAAALHDVVTSLRRRAPHIPLFIYPSVVQGAQAASELCEALLKCYARNEVDVILLVRGGGAMEDLWAFNDERLARIIVNSPVPLVSGVGHETDFTIADFCADVRAPTPTAAAELCAEPRAGWLDLLASITVRLQNGVDRQVQGQSQRLDSVTERLSRPSHFLTRQQAVLAVHATQLRHGAQIMLADLERDLSQLAGRFSTAFANRLADRNRRLDTVSLRLASVNPHLVLARGYVWLTNVERKAITSKTQLHMGQQVRATLIDGEVDLTVASKRLI